VACSFPARTVEARDAAPHQAAADRGQQRREDGQGQNYEGNEDEQDTDADKRRGERGAQEQRTPMGAVVRHDQALPIRLQASGRPMGRKVRGLPARSRLACARGMDPGLIWLRAYFSLPRRCVENFAFPASSFVR
jgi:hypothetical protein